MGKAASTAKRGPNPTDRAKMGTKKSLIVERTAGRSGSRSPAPTSTTTSCSRRRSTRSSSSAPTPRRSPQHLCLDKAYDNPTGNAERAAGYIPHIRRIGEEKLDTAGEKTHPARRWVVERTLAWLQKCRAILIRYDKKPDQLPRTHPTRLRPPLVPPTPPTPTTRPNSSRIVTKRATHIQTSPRGEVAEAYRFVEAGTRAGLNGGRTVDMIRPMKIFDFDPSDYTDTYKSQEWVHIREGVSEEFHELLSRYAREELSDHMLGSFAIKGKKEQSLFEFSEDMDYTNELFDVVARVCGLDRAGMTLSERHIQCYEADAVPEPPAHKDRFPSQVSVGLSIDIPPEFNARALPLRAPWRERLQQRARTSPRACSRTNAPR